MDAAEEGAQQVAAGRARPRREQPVAKDDASGPAVDTTGLGAADPRALQQREVQGDHQGTGVDDDHRVVRAQPPSGAQPGVRAVPGERPDRARKRLSPHGGARRRRPGHERDVVSRATQLVGEGDRVRRHPAGGRVGRPDERDAEER